MDANNIDLRSKAHRTDSSREAVMELGEAELSRVSGGKAKAVLALHCATGKHFPSVIITA
jgi:hypothetical protein